MILTRQIHNAKSIPEVADAHIYRLYMDDLLTMPLRSLGRDLGRAAYPVQARVNRVVQVIAFANTYV